MARLFSGRRKKLKCEAMASIMADCGSSHVTINFASSGAAGGLCASRVLDCGTESVFVPADIRELCDGCFKEHWSLRRVTFRPSSLLERIGVSCFEGTGVEEVSVPDGVRELCDGCFKGCKGLQRVTFGRSSLLERIGVEAFGIVRDRKAGDVQCDLGEINIPDGVRELCDGCFKGCKSLRRVTFGPSSSLERIGVSCFEQTGVEEVSVPDRVLELCERCFKGCKSLRRVTFGSSSSLERIGDFCFAGSKLVGFETPPSVKHIGRDILAAGVQLVVGVSVGRRGLTGMPFMVECDLADRIGDLKEKIYANLSAQPTCIIYEGRTVDEDLTLRECGIDQDSRVICQLR